MLVRVRSWRQQIKQHLVSILVGTIILVVIIALIIFGYRFDWTGFNGNNKSGKTLWDWMQLLFIPVVLAVAGFWFNHREREAAELRDDTERKAAELRADNERKAAELRAKAEQDLALDNQREAALQAYINEISEILLHVDDFFDKSGLKDSVRTILRVRTITILFQLDARRIGYVFSFLNESNLMTTDPVGNFVSLRNADLENINFSKARLNFSNLSGANLKGADLSGANLLSADLSEAQLVKANLSGANLIGANLSGANLSDVDLSGAYLLAANLTDAKVTEKPLKGTRSLKSATMPDGSIHP